MKQPSRKQPSSGWDEFIALCLSAKKPDMLSAVLDVFLTPEERKDIATRCLIVKALLAKQQTQREMAKELQVSIAKITRGSNELKRLDANLLRFLKQKLVAK